MRLIRSQRLIAGRFHRVVGQVIIVEDDAIIRQTLERAIVRLCPQCNLRTAESGQEALDLLETCPADLIISDHSMPTMTGLELFAETKKTHPEAKRYLVTAYPLSELNRDEVEAAALDGFIGKPFQMMELKNLIDSMKAT